MAVAVRHTDGALSDPASIENEWRERIQQAREHRKTLEPIWLSNLAFAAGQQWQVWDPRSKQMRHISEVDPRYADRELYTADKINEHVQAQLGELSTDDDRPELLLAQEGDTAEEIQKELNDCAAHGWENEWQSDQALKQARRLCLKLGVSAIRVRFDNTKGPVAKTVPVGADGQIVQDEPSLQHLEQTGQLPDGSLPKFQDVKEGRTLWEPLSAFNLLEPPGITHEDMLPWEVVVRPVPVDTTLGLYPHLTGLVEDTDIGSVLGVTTAQMSQSGPRKPGRLRNHVWLYTCYEHPCPKYPKGRVVVLAGNQFKLCDIQEELPYQTVDGEYRSGIHYFHWWRLDDRFWSRSFIEPMKDPQRLINRRETQNLEIIDRGQPKVFITEGDLPHTPQGQPMEMVALKQEAKEPKFFAGMGPGAWMYEDLAHHADNLAHASTLSSLRLGENPPNVLTLGQLSLLNENESVKRSVIMQEHKQTIAKCLEDSMHDVRKYWPEKKRIVIAGDEGTIRQKMFEKSKIPDFFVVKAARGSAKPRSQGAELTKVDAIWSAAHACGVTTASPQKWIDWYDKSLAAGEALDIPGEESGSQVDFAHFENYLLLDAGEQPQVAEHHLSPVHVPIHREAEDQALAAQDMEAVARIRQHITDHVQMVPYTRKAWRAFDPTDMNDLASDVALDEDQALRENEMLVQGVPLNPEELQKALMLLRQGINPESMQPVQQGDDLHSLLERAALKPTFIENFQMHMDRHGKVIKSDEFKAFPPDVRRRFFTHFDMTREMFLSLPTMPQTVDAPKVTLSLRESVGPSTIAQILRRAGVPEGDAQLLALEPPMENMIQDSVDKPDADGGSPGQTGSTAKPKPTAKKKPAAKPKKTP